jgi:hypothetical protein
MAESTPNHCGYWDKVSWYTQIGDPLSASVK